MHRLKGPEQLLGGSQLWGSACLADGRTGWDRGAL